MLGDERQYDEAALREAILRGSEAAWRTLYERYFDSHYAYVRWRLRGDGQRTDDVVQECWLTAVRRIRDFDSSRAQFGTWLRGIADNTIRSTLKKHKRHGALEVESEDWLDRAHARPHGDDLPESVRVALSALPDHYRDVICAKYRDGMSVLEIATARGQSGKAIESLLTRAREAFRREYRKLQEEL